MNEAERLADALEQGTYLLYQERDATAAELRRLSAINADLVKALELSLPCLSWYWKEKAYEALEKAKQ